PISGQGDPQPLIEGDAVPDDRARNDRRPRDGQRPPRGGYADEHGNHADLEQPEPPGLLGAILDVFGFQQRVREVHAPHHDRVGEASERDEVDHQPPRGGEERVHEGDQRRPEGPEAAGPAPYEPRAPGTHISLLSEGAGAGGRSDSGRVRVPSTEGVTSMTRKSRRAATLSVSP